MTRTQIKHLLYKEWLKTRWFAAVSLLLGIILSTYACIDALSSFHSLGGAFFYSTLLSGNISLMGQLKYLPLGVALLIGLSQFMPEITNKRIRLTLHPSHRRDGCRLYDDIVRRRSLLLCAVAGGSHHDDNDGGMFSRRNNHTSMADAISLVAGRNDKLFLRSHDCI